MKDVKTSDTYNFALVGHSGDGKTSLGEIHLALDPKLDWPHFKARFDALYRPLNGFGFLLIANPKA